MKLYVDLLCESFGYTTKQRSTTSEPDAILYNIGVQLWRCALEDFDYFTLYL